MAIARKHLIDDHHPGCYHLASRCVRQSHLCGKAYAYRREWILELVQTAAEAFAVDLFTFAIMENHFHLVLRLDPRQVESWSDEEVVRRWAVAHPKKPHSDHPRPWTPEEKERCQSDKEWVARHRLRLASISWFMKGIKERIAKRANREDDVTGHFWEARFHSTRLLDQRAVLACMVYVDLNPIRACLAERPERSRYTGIASRCAAHKCPTYNPDPDRTGIVHNTLTATSSSGKRTGKPTRDPWITPIQRCTISGRANGIDLDDYLTLVDRTGRQIRSDKKGYIPPDLPPILERLAFDAGEWISLMRRSRSMQGAAIGHYATRAEEAARRGVKWIANRVGGLYRNSQLSI